MSSLPLREELFSLGQVVATPGALGALEESGETPFGLVARHQNGDWGEVPVEDARANLRALKDGSRIFSAYRTKRGDRASG